MKTTKLKDFPNPQKPWEVEGVEWREVRLGEIGFLQYGYTQKAKHDKRGPKFLRITDIDLETSQVKWNNVPYCDIDEKNYAKYKLNDEDILIARIGGTTGKACIIKNPPESVFASYLIRFCIVDKEKVGPDFVYYFTKSQKYWDQITLNRIGKLKEGVNATQLKNLKIPLPFRNGKPDLETQKKIVEYIEANFSRIDKILEKKKQELEKLDELWESVLEHAFKPKEREEWREVRLEEIAKTIGGSTAPQNKKFYENGKHLFVRVSDLGARKNYTPIFDTRDKLNEEGVKKNKLVSAPKDTIVFPKSGAAILTNSRGILGKAAFIVNHLAGVIALEGKSYPRYLLFYLSKIDMSKHISPNSSYPSLKLETIKNLKIPIPFRNNQPDVEKQKEIANYLDGVYEKIKALKEKIQNQINQLEEMKESILDEVFNHENKK
ncbi:MAG: restriction endonuclease subunit S [Thermoplasmata archaeon]|nr:restriction endonuclease subunit S [Thermoplasmata archaeon]